MELYERIKAARVDLRPLGLEYGPKRGGYFCTPIGASVLYWSGTGGIHYCTVRGSGETVFAVNPGNTPGSCVHPVAGDPVDFLRLVLACAGEAAVEQAYQWDRDQFDLFLRENPPSEKQRAAAARLAEQFQITPMGDPFSYIKELQERFDYRELRFKREYRELEALEDPGQAEWKVFYHGGFFFREGREREGKEIPSELSFQWAGFLWHVPAVYSCSAGLVIDLCGETEPERVRPWEETLARTPEEQERLDAENPLCLGVEAEGEINGRPLEMEREDSIRWIPPLPGETARDQRERQVLEHYGLDPEKVWTVKRFYFPWPGKKRLRWDRLKLTFRQRLEDIPGPHFTVHALGDPIPLKNPLTGVVCALTAEELVRERMDIPRDKMTEYPSCYTRMTYTLEPDLDDGRFRIVDCAQGDSLRSRISEKYGLHLPHARPELLFGICSGEKAEAGRQPDGTPAIPKKRRMAASALRFAPADEVEWRIVFRERRHGEITAEVRRKGEG